MISVRIVTTSRLKYFVYFRSNLPGLQLRRLQGCHQFSAKIPMARNFNAHILWRQFLIRSYFQDMNHGKHQFKVVIWIIINRLRSCNINILKYMTGLLHEGKFHVRDLLEPAIFGSLPWAYVMCNRAQILLHRRH